MLRSSDESLAGSPRGKALLEKFAPSDPTLIMESEAARVIGASAARCAVGERGCFKLVPGATFSETIFLDELADAMVGAGKAKMVTREEAVATLGKYQRHPKVLSKLSGRPLELCCTPGRPRGPFRPGKTVAVQATVSLASTVPKMKVSTDSGAFTACDHRLRACIGAQTHFTRGRVSRPRHPDGCSCGTPTSAGSTCAPEQASTSTRPGDSAGARAVRRDEIAQLIRCRARRAPIRARIVALHHVEHPFPPPGAPRRSTP
jgi:hypothetical protein